MSNILEVTLGLIVVVISFMYIQDILDALFMWDVLFAVVIFGGALVYLYSNVR